MKIFGIVGWKNSGKTGLMERLVSEITARGLSVSTIKHAHHSVDLDQPGKDSYRHRVAGAQEVVLATSDRWAILHELRGAPEPSLSDLMSRMAPVDLVLVEGFKSDTHPRIEAHRHETGQPLLINGDPAILGVASDTAVAGDFRRFDLNDTGEIADFILAHLGISVAGSQ